MFLMDTVKNATTIWSKKNSPKKKTGNVSNVMHGFYQKDQEIGNVKNAYQKIIIPSILINIVIELTSNRNYGHLEYISSVI